jgi:hypothetical protein
MIIRVIKSRPTQNRMARRCDECRLKAKQAQPGLCVESGPLQYPYSTLSIDHRGPWGRG